MLSSPFSFKLFKIILILWIIINFNSNNVRSQTISKTRFTHSAYLIDNKLWFFSGGTFINGMLYPTSDVFHVDLTKTFDTTNVEYTAEPSSPFSCAWCQSAMGGNDGSTIFFFAGVMAKPDLSGFAESTIYYFDIRTKTWIAPKTTGQLPTVPRRRELQPVTDNNGKIYMFGGGVDMSLGSQNVRVFNTMDVLDSNSLTWSSISQENPPLPKIDYTAILLSDGNIIYIGGSQTNPDPIQFSNIDMNKIDQYNTMTSTWTTITAVGDTVSERTGHSAVLKKNGEIIIFGGAHLPPNLVASEPKIAVLNTTTKPFQWSIPKVNTSEINPPNLIFHTATIVENYMVVAFGNKTKTTPNDAAPGQNDQLYFLDINTFTWVKTYNPPSNTNPSPTPGPEPNPLSNKIIIIMVVIAAFIVAIAITIGVIIYRKKFKKSGDDLKINLPPHMDQQSIPTSQLDNDTSSGMHQYSGDTKQQNYITRTLLPNETSNQNQYSSDTNITHAQDNTNQSASNQFAGYNNQSVSYNNQFAGYNNQSASYNNQPSGYNDQPSGYNNQPSDYNNNQPSGYNDQPSGYNNQPSDYNNNQPSDYNNNQPSGYNNQPSDYNNNQFSGYNNPTGYNNQFTGYNNQLSRNINQFSGYANQLAGNTNQFDQFVVNTNNQFTGNFNNNGNTNPNVTRRSDTNTAPAHEYDNNDYRYHYRQ